MVVALYVNHVIDIAVSALIPAIATVFGSSLIFLHLKVGEKLIDSGMGFAAGLMIYVSFIDLLVPSIEFGTASLPLVGFIAGLAMIKSLDLLVPHINVIRSRAQPSSTDANLSKTILIALAIAIHNIPEGIAVGSSTMYSIDRGVRVALSIAIQDIPEGLAVAIPIYVMTGSSLKSFCIGTVSGAVEYLSSFIALIGAVDTGTTLPILLALSASAMIYVVVHEIAPEIFGHEHDEYATVGLFTGLLTGLLFDLFYK
ncbi:MAG: ZIP family metal transporter [Ignisphaera sp.]|nr:ZIP family metal transporter [Ignisphaera sp.]MDW8085692.1 ZIP family metal transporter [Ignisphaera sp.]